KASLLVHEIRLPSRHTDHGRSRRADPTATAGRRQNKQLHRTMKVIAPHLLAADDRHLSARRKTGQPHFS
ncbi:MAG: hypothetical protein R3184_06645, partial [Aurantimonas coralicida]|nr:hypothetical protein [Aurantimonas coralicida]